ncbi:head GIN domain-containing protein [Massilia yuzhufengensis]|uniref:Putative auto-transporter adhesin, head GIN domain n=1 Tax=Massilia yuzhufengensis TaxID=1164594 RepID=A0A1I1F3B7_9BURK|nr:head GIN domain-containing protein [Massilia yuzhufengensis]SFB91653.1 Putative auto-transporter adhesin, head GIN domain [Massilia yuzhufengensis]
MNKTSPATIALRSIVLAAALACAAAPSTAGSWPWSGEQVQGSGSIKRQARQVSHFTGLAFEVPGKLELRMGDTESVTIETDDNLLPLVETVVENGTLKIRPSKRNLNLRTKNLKVVVTARQIERLALGGSGSVDADTLRAPRLNIDLGGSGEINVRNLDSESVAVSLGGSGDFKAGGGNARKLSVSIGGSGTVDMGKVQSDSASISVAGSGEATVWARHELSMTIAGSGDVNYYGDPRVSKSVVGSGDARRVAAAPR